MRTLCGIGVLVLSVGIGGFASTGLRATPALPAAAVAGDIVTPPAHTAGAQAPTRLTVQDYETREKNIGTTYPEMRKNLAAKNMEKAADEAQELATWFGDVERFWAQNTKQPAMTLAQSARTLATEIAGAATAGDAAKASQLAAKMDGVCTQCHTTYREVDPAGGFRVKAKMLTAR